jgi:hypothetical protein
MKASKKPLKKPLTAATRQGSGDILRSVRVYPTKRQSPAAAGRRVAQLSLAEVRRTNSGLGKRSEGTKCGLSSSYHGRSFISTS